MSNTDFLGRAIDQVRKAIEADNAAQYDKAYQMYYQSLELFMLALKWEKNPKSKEMIRTKTAEYMDRLKTIFAIQWSACEWEGNAKQVMPPSCQVFLDTQRSPKSISQQDFSPCVDAKLWSPVNPLSTGQRATFSGS